MMIILTIPLPSIQSAVTSFLCKPFNRRPNPDRSLISTILGCSKSVMIGIGESSPYRCPTMPHAEKRDRRMPAKPVPASVLFFFLFVAWLLLAKSKKKTHNQRVLQGINRFTFTPVANHPVAAAMSCIFFFERSPPPRHSTLSLGCVCPPLQQSQDCPRCLKDCFLQTPLLTSFVLQSPAGTMMMSLQIGIPPAPPGSASLEQQNPFCAWPKTVAFPLSISIFHYPVPGGQRPSVRPRSGGIILVAKVG